MDPDGNSPFKPGATDPLLGNETCGEEDHGFSEAVTNATTNQSTEYNAYMPQEWGVGSTLDPSMLPSSDLTPPEVALGIPTGPSVDAYVPSVFSGIQRSHDET